MSETRGSKDVSRAWSLNTVLGRLSFLDSRVAVVAPALTFFGFMSSRREQSAFLLECLNEVSPTLIGWPG